MITIGLIYTSRYGLPKTWKGAGAKYGEDESSTAPIYQAIHAVVFKPGVSTARHKVYQC